MSCINKVKKDVFGEVPTSFMDAVQAALGSIPNDGNDVPPEADDKLRMRMVEAFSAVKASEGTVDAVMQKANKTSKKT